LKKFDEANRLYEEEIKYFGLNHKNSMLVGVQLKHQKKYQEALESFNSIRQKYPDRYDSWELCIECLLAIKNRDGLKNLLAESEGIGSRKDREWLNTVIVKAIAELDIEIRPKHETLSLYLEKNPENGTLKYANASALENTGNPSRAYALFKEITDSSKHFIHIQGNAFFRMARLAPLDEKEALLKKCIKLNPSHQGAQSMLNEAQETHSSTIDSIIETDLKLEPSQRICPESPCVSVIVPNWNGINFVGMCLDSLAQLHFENFEVIVVDNGSTDGSRELIEEKYPWVRLQKLPHNMGFAIACNEGIKTSNAKYVVLLNNDIEVTPNWLTELYDGMERHPECGMGTTKMMFLDNRDVFYNTGDLFHSWSSGGGRGQGEKDIGQYDLENYVFGACAGAGIYRKELFNQIGLFDEDFFIFAEDVDLNMRSQLQGFQAVYLPKSKVYHIGTATVGLYSDRYVYLCKRNDIWVFIKNYSLKMYFKYLRSIWKHQFADIRYFTYRGQGHVLFKSKWDALKLLPKMLFRRFKIQRARTTSDFEIQKHIITD